MVEEMEKGSKERDGKRKQRERSTDSVVRSDAFREGRFFRRQMRGNK